VNTEDLQSFTASFAKWRYETGEVVMRQLRKVRYVAEHYVTEELFPNFKDRATLVDVCRHCKDFELWKFISVVWTMLMQPLEGIRRWGMCCPCCHESRAASPNKRNRCKFAGRRLAGAWEFVSDRIEEFKENAKHLTEDACEGSRLLFKIVKDMLTLAASALHQRFKYLSLLPWRLATVATVEGSKACVEQWASRPPQDHDPYTRRIMEGPVGAAIVMRAAGGALTDVLCDFIKRICWSSLDESAGEGYHRGTNLEQIRAPSSTQAHLKRKSREKKVISNALAFIRKYKERGKAVIRFEWARYKRVLQRRGRRFFKNKQMKAAPFFARIYREDDMAQEDWTQILERLPVDRPVEPDSTNDRKDVLMREWIVASLEQNHHYSIDVEKQEPDETGAPQDVTEQVHFKVIDLAYGQHRPKLMHTFQSAEDPALVADLALNVAMFDEWKPEPAEAPADEAVVAVRRHVFQESDSEWVAWTRLADTNTWCKQLTHWRTVDPCEDHACVLVLTDPEPGGPKTPLMDPHCPVLVLVKELRRRGWHSVQHLVLHDTTEIGAYDGREALKMRTYYQVCLCVQRCVPLAISGIPSQEPISYYRLLLLGVPVEWGMPAKEYNRLLDVEKRKRGKDLEPPPLVERPCAIGRP